MSDRAYFHYRQLCWTCIKCTSGYLCRWVAKKKYYNGTILDEYGFITSCPKYVKEVILKYNNKNKYNRKYKLVNRKHDYEIAKELGVTPGYYSSVKHYIKAKKMNISIEEYIKKHKKKVLPYLI